MQYLLPLSTHQPMQIPKAGIIHNDVQKMGRDFSMADGASVRIQDVITSAIRNPFLIRILPINRFTSLVISSLALDLHDDSLHVHVSP